MAKLLCVEDAPEIAIILEKLFEEHDLRIARSLKDARRMLEEEAFSLIILDIQLPDGSGLELSAEIQAAHRSVPIMFLSGQSDFASKATAFSLGADDFIVKPFDPKELKLRVESKLRKTSVSTDSGDLIKLGDLRCHLNEQRIYRQGNSEPIDLTSLEFRIFRLLAKTPNKIFSRAEILDRIWGDSFSVTERAVDVHISHLRKKLDSTGVTIESVIGSGYRILVQKI